MKNKILPVFIPFAGCKNKCIFCNQPSITGINENYSTDSIINQIKKYLKYSHSWDEIAFYGGSFSCLPYKDRKNLYNIVDTFGFKKIRFSTRPDCIDLNLIEEFLENNVTTIELGIQSMNDEILIKNKRTYTSNEVISSINILKNKFKLGIQIMPGLYGESFDTLTETVNSLLNNHIDYARIYPACVYKNTELYDMYKNSEYLPPTLSEAIIYTAYSYVKFENKNIKIIRMGLPIVENDSDFVAGPKHESFGELVKTYIIILYSEINPNVNLPAIYAGYKKIVKIKFPELFKNNSLVLDNNLWQNIIKSVAEYYFESDLWYLQRPIIANAEIIENKAYYG